MNTLHFGEIDFGEEEIIEFSGGLLGFENLTRFVLIQSEDYFPFKFLQSVENPVISFPLLSPLMVRSDYHVTLSGNQLSGLDLREATRAIVYCIVTIGKDPGQITANLFSPVVINPESGKAAQLIFPDSGYPVDAKVLRSN